MKEQDLREKIEDTLYNSNGNCGGTYKCVQIAKDYAEQEAIEFSDWKDKNTYPHPFEENKYQFFSWHNDQETYTLKELYQLFKTKENER